MVHKSKNSENEHRAGVNLCIKNSHLDPGWLEDSCVLVLVGDKNGLKVEHHLVALPPFVIQMRSLRLCKYSLPYRAEKGIWAEG